MTEFDSRKITLGEKYVLGGGFGSWAKSIERGARVGDVRMIGGVLMYAYSIHSRGPFRKKEVNWVPVDESIKRDFENVRRFQRGERPSARASVRKDEAE